MGSIRNIICYLVVCKAGIQIRLLRNLGGKIPDFDDVKLTFRRDRNANQSFLIFDQEFI